MAAAACLHGTYGAETAGIVFERNTRPRAQAGCVASKERTLSSWCPPPLTPPSTAYAVGRVGWRGGCPVAATGTASLLAVGRGSCRDSGEARILTAAATPPPAPEW